MSYLLSIVVPTKDRYYYLKHLIQLVKGFDSDEIELVIQDNSSDNSEFVEYLDCLNYKHLKYFYDKNWMPISQNCDKAILNSSGKYVCFIGDDDGVTRDILKWVKWMQQNNVSVMCPKSISYNWPDCSIVAGINNTGVLSNIKFSNNIINYNTADILAESMHYGFVSRGRLPVLYHGVVERKVLDSIYEKGNTFFPGPSPDIANAVALSLVVSEFVVVDAPIVISGASKEHGGRVRTMKNRAADINDVPFLPMGAAEVWEKKIPHIWSNETVWSESAVKALRYMGREDLIDKVNFEYLYISFVIFHFAIRKMAYNLSQDKFGLFIHSFIGIIKRYFNGGIRLLRTKFRRILNSEIAGINNIIEAENALYERCKNKN